MPEKKTPPSLFSLMTALSAEERQKFAARRRAMKARDGVKEHLVEAKGGKWRLEYRLGKTLVDELPL